MLRQALGSFPALPLAPRVPVVAFLTAFLSTPDASRGWALGDKCKLVSADGSAATYAHQELVGEEIQGNLNDGKLVAQLGIVMRDAVSATLTTDLVLKSIKFLVGADIHDAEDAVQVSMLRALEFERVATDLFSIFQCETPA